MINVKDKIVEQLEKIVENLSDMYPQDFINFPAVSYTEEENKIYEYTSEGEASSYLRYRIDIWSNRSTSSTAVAVDKVMSKLGFKRIACNDVPEQSGLKHKLMRYEGIIDVATERVYHSSY